MADSTSWPRGPMDKASAYGAGDCRFSPAGVIFSNWQVSNIVPHAISPFHTAHHCPHFQLWTIEGDDDGDGGATGPCDPTPSTQRARTTPAQSAQRKTLNRAHSSIQRRQR
jgi:hypothetical protein